MDTVNTAVTLDELFSGTYPVKKRAVTLTGGGTYTRGALIGVLTADVNTGTIVDEAKSDGTQLVDGVLMDQSVDTSGGDKKATIALTGDFNQAALNAGGTKTVPEYQAEARAKCIFIDETALPV